MSTTTLAGSEKLQSKAPAVAVPEMWETRLTKVKFAGKEFFDVIHHY
jgi:hypothetical protein